MQPRTIPDLLIQSARRRPEKALLIHKGLQTSYGQLLEWALKTAGWLRELGVCPGFRGAILSDDPQEYIASYFGIMMAGGIAVGLNSQTSERALTYYLQDSGAELLFMNRRYARLVEKVTQEAGKALPLKKSVDSSGMEQIWQHGTAPSYEDLAFRTGCDPAQIIYTSGTTGRPKGVVLRHANLLSNTASIVEYLGILPEDRVMAVLPFFYSYGNSILLTHIAKGATLIVNQNFVYPNTILDEMVRWEATGFSGVPSTYALLIYRSNLSKYSFPSLRYLTQAGAPMSPALAHRLLELFPGVDIFIMYGQTEASARLSYLPPGELLKRPGSIGIPIPGVELRLLDDDGRKVPRGETGEIVARGENIMAGYWNAPEATAQVLRPEGLRTGDLAWQDEEGYFYIVSRKSDMIKSGSHRIAPKEIEDVAMEFDGLAEAAVVGVSDTILGEAIWLFAVPDPNATVDMRLLKRHLRQILPAYKVPHEIRLVDSLPKTATGKIKKQELKDQAEQEKGSRHKEDIEI